MALLGSVLSSNSISLVFCTWFEHEVQSTLDLAMRIDIQLAHSQSSSAVP